MKKIRCIENISEQKMLPKKKNCFNSLKLIEIPWTKLQN